MQFLRQQTAFTVIRKQLKNWSARFFAKMTKKGTACKRAYRTCGGNCYQQKKPVSSGILWKCQSACVSGGAGIWSDRKKYNKLIEQKTVFAKRALARIHYILQEGSSDEDHIVKLINLLDHHANSPQVLEQMRDRIRVGTQFKNITDRSFYNRKNAEDAGFHPIAMEKHNEETQMTDFVPKPLYTKNSCRNSGRKISWTADLSRMNRRFSP